MVTRLASAGGNVDALPLPSDTPQPAPPTETPIALPNQAAPANESAPGAAQAPAAGNVPVESSPDQPSGPVH